jgi:putative ABC transport system substrate-binding protein
MIRLFSTLFCALLLSNYAEADKSVAITQIVSHAALNAVRDGVIATIEKCPDLQNEVRITKTDANGSLTVASQIAQRLLSESPDVIVAISTPSAQTVVKAFRGKTPVVFAAITDPVHANLIDPRHPGKNLVTGVTDLPPFKEQLNFIRKLLPKLSKLGILYNAGEDNSRASVATIKKIARAMGITIVDVSVSKVADIPPATAHLKAQVDAIYIPNDNLLAASLESVIKVAYNQPDKIPVFAADILLVERGALAMEGISYNDIGIQVGKMVCEILKGKRVEEIPVKHPSKTQIYLNLRSAKVLGITFSKALLDNADRIIGQENIEKK